MRQKKLASSKSKSQIVTQQIEPTPYYFDPFRVEPIANAPSVPQDGVLTSDPYSTASDAAEVVITLDYGRWCIACGHVKTPISDDKGNYFRRSADPVMVAKYLASKAAGPINVVWW